MSRVLSGLDQGDSVNRGRGARLSGGAGRRTGLAV